MGMEEINILIDKKRESLISECRKKHEPIITEKNNKKEKKEKELYDKLIEYATKELGLSFGGYFYLGEVFDVVHDSDVENMYDERNCEIDNIRIEAGKLKGILSTMNLESDEAIKLLEDYLKD